MTNTAAVLDSVDNLDAFSTPATVTISASKVREGMVLVDPTLGTPLYWIDAKLRSTPKSGAVKFNVWNLETGRFETGITITARATVPAMAR